MNRLVAGLLFFVFLPVLLCIALIVKLDSSGPFVFSQKRVGRHGQLYQMYKFRTMVTGMPDLPSDQVGETDSRITNVGRILRRLSLDELPQLWNVMKGEMNFIGPRPALYNQYDLNEMRSQLGIDVLKPGITGWAQVNGRDSISLERKVALDQYYLENHTWRLDVRILWMTVFKSAIGDGLYRS